MLLSCFVTLAFVGLAKIVEHPQYPERVLKDEVTNLPGLWPGFSTKMFSGYIEIKGGSRGIFYWFIESERDPSNDPVVMWTNGGPGCSGLDGLLTEMGPFKPMADGSLVMNKYRWNQVANMIFIEQPAGVGFSWTKKSLDYDDSLAASDNADFIESWLTAFSNFENNDFYIASESYGGHYMPTLTKELFDRGTVKTFKGMVVGNPLTWMPYRNYGQYATAAGRNMYPKPQWDQYINYTCAVDDTNYRCYQLEMRFDKWTEGTDPYALDFPVCIDDLKRAGRNQRYYMARAIHRANKQRRHMMRHKMGLKGKLGGYFPEDYEPCIEDYMSKYLQRSDVRKALHISSDSATTWEMCNGDINGGWSRTDLNAPMMPVYDYLVSNSNLKIMIYSGDDDSICATSGTQMFLWDMGWKINEEWMSWTVDDQVAGYVVKFEGFTFLTVHGAGHMVPATRPEFAYAMFKGYLDGTWFKNGTI